MKRTTRACVSVAAAAMLAAALTACDDPVAAEDTEPTAPAPTEAAEQDEGDAAPADPGEITPPGTELAVGETAIIPFEDGVIALTVTAIEVGDQAAFESEFEDAEGLTPYYIWVTGENVSGEDLGGTRLPQLRALTEDLRTTGVVLFGSSLGECEIQRFPDGAGSGETVESCNLQASRADVPVGAVRYEESDGGYRDDPIVWRA